MFIRPVQIQPIQKVAQQPSKFISTIKIKTTIKAIISNLYINPNFKSLETEKDEFTYFFKLFDVNETI